MSQTQTRQSTKRQRWHRLAFGAALALAFTLALLLRVPHLEDRPMHVDESVQATKAGHLYDTGEYRYNPFEFHGPTLYYFTLPVIRLSGAASFAQTREATFRVMPLIFGVGLILLLPLLTPGLGRSAVAVAALLTALSPAMAFFSRYYIQEMLLVFFTFGALIALWRFAASRRTAWAIAAGTCLGLMFATKETCIIAFGSMAAAGALTLLASRLTHARSVSESTKNPDTENPAIPLHATPRFRRQLALAAAAFLAVAILFYSSFFSHWPGVIDSLKAFYFYANRAGGSGSAGLHDHPWNFYFHLLLWYRSGPGPVWSEGLIFALSLVGVLAALLGRVARGTSLPLARFLAFYTLFMALAYSIIPYKTPWTMLGFLHGWILMAGIGAAAMGNWLPGRWTKALAVIFLVAGLAQLGAQASRTNFLFAADSRNPHVYAHSTRDVIRLAERLETLASLHPDGRSMLIRFITDDYWPMPWYLRAFDNVGYWHDEIPDEVDAPIVITSPEREEAVTAKMQDEYQVEYYGLRHEVLMAVYIRADLWEAFIEQVASKRTPASQQRKRR